LEHVTHQHVSKPAQEQDEQLMQPMGINPMNALNMDATQKGRNQ